MKLKQLIYISFFAFAQSIFAADLQCKKDYETVISKNIIEMSTAFNSGNLQYIANKTDSSLIDYIEGKDAYKSLLELTVYSFINNNIVVSKVETRPPQDNFIIGNNEICFIPKQLTIMINGKQQPGSESFMLAVRPLESKDWKYLDGSGLQKNPAMLYILFPDFPSDIKFSFKNYPILKIDAEKKYDLGMMYSTGLGGEKDDKKAFFWFSQAAQQGNIDAQLRLGMIYILGRGIPKDNKKAFEWINKAAEQNNADAQYFLGSMYQSGEGVEKDKRKALEWFHKSAQQGNEKAIEELKNY